MKKELEKNKGITLIALVITIIVLLILAGVSIATLTGENGILTKAQRAEEETKKASEEEQRQLAIAEATMNFEETEYQGIKIPAGMAPTRIEGESTVGEGLVAIDKKGNEWVWIEVPKSIYTKSAYNEGTPPSGEADYDAITRVLKKYAYPYTKGSATQNFEWTDEWYLDTGTGDSHNIVTEGTASNTDKQLSTGCGLTLSKYKETYETMLKSVYNNGGFWIGRYEAGIEGSTGKDATNLGRTSHTNTDKGAICQKDAIPYNYVYCSEAQKLASQMTPDSTRTSTLMFGIQWDLVCKYLEVKSDLNENDINSDSKSWGNYNNQTLQIDSENAKQYTSGSGWSTIEKGEINTGSDGILLSTGASDSTKRLNIYDFAGNEFEWTLEYATGRPDHPCSLRGGDYMADSTIHPASGRGNNLTTIAYTGPSFRPALY